MMHGQKNIKLLSASVIKTGLLMMYTVKGTVSSESHTKHINTM